MPPVDSFEAILAVSALAFLIAGFAMQVVAVWRGRRLMRRLAHEYPAIHEDAGQPWPVYFNTWRMQQYTTFIMQRGYQAVTDPTLLAAFDALRRLHIRFMVFLLGGFLVLGGAVLWLKYIAD